MFKKFLILPIVILAAVMILVGGTGKAQAQDVYMGDYVDGSQIWLMTETIEKITMNDFNVRVKSVRNGKIARYIDYSFGGGPVPGKGFEIEFNNSDGRHGKYTAKGVDEWSPVEHNIFDYYQKVWSSSLSS